MTRVHVICEGQTEELFVHGQTTKKPKQDCHFSTVLYDKASLPCLPTSVLASPKHPP